MGPVSLATASPETLRAEIMRLNAKIVELCLERDHNLIRIGELHHIAEEHKGCASVRTELEALQKKNEQLEQENIALKKRVEQLEAENTDLHTRVSALTTLVERHHEIISQLRGSSAQLLAAQTVWCLQYKLAEKVLGKYPDKWNQFRKNKCGAFKKDRNEAIITRVRFDLLVEFIQGDKTLEKVLDGLITPLVPEEADYYARVKVVSSRFFDLTSTTRVDAGHPCTDEKGAPFTTTEHLVSVVAQADFEADVLNETIIAAAKLLGTMSSSENLLFRAAKW